MMLATVTYQDNPFDRTQRKVVEIRRRRRIDKLAPKTEQPFICILNGEPLLRAKKGWHKSLKDGDVLAFVTLPQGGGGGGSSPLKIVMMIALSVAAPGIGSFIAEGAGLGVGATAGTFLGMTASDLVGMAVGFVGRMLINALMPTPKPTSPQAIQTAAAASPTYNLNSQGNTARLMNPIPSLYGRHLIYPDFAAESYTEYAGEEQYLYELFCLGQGELAIEQIRIEDTPISSFPEITTEVVGPGGNITLFPTNVTSAPEVSGQEMVYNVVLGPFTANPSGSVVNFIAVDAVCPKGLFYANDNGGLDVMSLSFQVQARPIDNTGAVIAPGTWTTLGTETITGATATPLRRSFRYAVAQARYQVQVTRTTVKNTSSRVGHDVMWSALRSYMPGTQNYGNVTMLAIRMRASNSLSSQSSRRVNVIATRKLPIWNGTTWSANTATRSIAWALADALKASYGGKLPDSRIDLAQLLAFDAIWSARGDYFDAVFDSRMGIWEAITAIAIVGRAKPYRQGGIVHFTRDAAVTLPVALFNMRNIVKGSVNVEYLIPTDQTADAVTMQYFDSTTWSPKEITASLPGSSVAQPAKVQLFGSTESAHSWREGMYMSAANRYRRMIISFQSEMEGFIPTFGDLIAIAHDRANWGQSGEVLAWDSVSKILTLSEPITFTTGTHYIGLRRRDGSFSGPYVATVGADAYHVVLATAPDFTPFTGNTEERTTWCFGPGEQYRKLARVMSVKPRSMNTVEIVSVNEDAAVHTADTSIAPPASTSWNLPAVITRPVVSGLNVTLGGTASAPLALINWLPAAGADHYYVDISNDSGNTWQRVAQPSATNASVPARRGNISVRVAGVGISMGDWATWTGNPFKAPPPDILTFLIDTQADGTRQFSWTMNGTPPPDLSGYKIRYKLGTGWIWDNMSDLHVGLLTASPFETNLLAAGTYTFAIKAVDDSGIYSTNATYISGTIGDPRMAGVIYSENVHLNQWPGTLTNCHVIPESQVLSANDSSTWATPASWGAFVRWNQTPLSPITFQRNDIDVGAVVSCIPYVAAVATGVPTIDLQTSINNVAWSAWGPAGVMTTARYFRIRISVAGAYPEVSQLTLRFAGTPQTEDLQNINMAALTGAYRIGVGNIRLPITKTYSVITQVQVALQNIGPGWSWELIDKNTATGPQIKTYNASNVLADCTIDALVRGF